MESSKDRNRDEQRRRILVHAQNKIPVYIGYFTAWVDADGVVHFYEDVYKRDEALASLLFDK
jgi:murein L,D-transpeptidase YcbB/YkuD